MAILICVENYNPARHEVETQAAPKTRMASSQTVSFSITSKSVETQTSPEEPPFDPEVRTILAFGATHS